MDKFSCVNIDETDGQLESERFDDDELGEEENTLDHPPPSFAWERLFGKEWIVELLDSSPDSMLTKKSSSSNLKSLEESFEKVEESNTIVTCL